MTNQYPRLAIKNHTYYIRVAIPRHLQKLAKRKEIRYSLGTSRYFEAIHKLRIESAKIDKYIKILDTLHMQLKNNKIILSDEELDKLLIFRIREIEDFIDFSYDDILGGKANFDDFALFSSKSITESHLNPQDIFQNPEFHKNIISNLIKRYIKWLANKPTSSLSLITINNKIQELSNEIEFEQDKNSTIYPNQLDYLLDNLMGIEIYGSSLTRDAKTGKQEAHRNKPKIEKLIQYAKKQKDDEMIKLPDTSTPWIEIFNAMVRPDLHSKNISEETIKTKKQCLKTIFELIDKQYIEDITITDCQRINRLIYLIPKKWKENNPGKKLLDVLLPDDMSHQDQAISSTSVNKYLTIFQEFLKYCRQQQLINNDLADIIVKPKVEKHKNVWQPFETEELKKIFNPKTYFKKMLHSDNPKYWIPLIGLYTGARLNEICQIRIDDVKSDDGIWYFQISDMGEKQSVKNYASVRNVPIHPVLINLGFLEQVNLARKQKQDRIFYSLQYNSKNKYGGAMSKAFQYYLDKIGLKDAKKVFHSFRHTVRTKFINSNVSEETANIICGWEGQGAGAKNYLHREKIDMHKLYTELSKLSYPEIEEMLFSSKM